jgi:serine/threonine protein kinase
MADKHGWDLARGEDIAPGLVAMRLLGGGERYEAYLAFDEVRYCPAVVKVVRPDQVDDTAALRGLRREYDLAARLVHPGLPRAYALVEDGPRPLLVLEHVEGPRLSTLLRKHGALPLHQLLPLAIEVAGVLHYLGHEQVVHLDVKPSNIVMGSPPKLIDLSIARPVEEARQVRHVLGTDRYLAPEQADPERFGGVGTPADVWGLAATLAEAASGVRPFRDGVRDDGARPEERWPQLVEPAQPLPPSVPAPIARALTACLDPDPAHRPRPAQLAEAMEPVLAALPKPVLAGLKPGRSA